MTQLTVPNPQDLQGQVLFDASGVKIGIIEGVYLDNATRAPEWAAVRLGPEALALVPLADASPARGGARVDVDAGTVLDAPFQLTALDDEVTEETEQLLYEYYEAGGSSPAVDEAKEVLVHVAAAEAKDLAETTKGQLESQAETQIEQLAETLHRPHVPEEAAGGLRAAGRHGCARRCRHRPDRLRSAARRFAAPSSNARARPAAVRSPPNRLGRGIDRPLKVG